MKLFVGNSFIQPRPGVFDGFLNLPDSHSVLDTIEAATNDSFIYTEEVN
jgi:hypothetical protein